MLQVLQLACEQLDERAALRVQVLKGSSASDRRALRALDRQVSENLLSVTESLAPPAKEDPFDLLAAELSAAVGDPED
jgi:hypothetical protein